MRTEARLQPDRLASFLYLLDIVQTAFIAHFEYVAHFTFFLRQFLKSDSLYTF